MFRGSSMGIGAGPLYTNAIMGQTLTAAERENARKASSTILREDRIQIEESESASRPDSFSIHYNYTDQAPYSTGEDGAMMTQNSLLHIPSDNPSHDLALFLRLTGPTQPHRRPSRLGNGERSLSSRGRSLRFLKLKRRRSLSPPTMTQERASFVPGDQVGSLAAAKLGLVEQKVTADGTKYLALNVKEDPKVLDSRISVLVVPREADDLESGAGMRKSIPRLQPRPPTPATILSQRAASHFDEESRTERAGFHASVCPAAPSPPTPEPASAISVTYSLCSETEKWTARPTGERERRWPKHMLGTKKMASASLPNMLHDIEPPSEDKRLSLARRGEMRHPTPQRFASHPILSQTISRVASDMSPRSVSDSPGPPERSPLRLRRAGGALEDSQQTLSERKPTIKAVPSIMSFREYNNSGGNIAPIIRPTVVTDCTGPIKRPKERSKNQKGPTTPSKSFQEREERIRERKLRDRPTPTRRLETTATTVTSSKTPPTPRQRLKKARPQIQIPNLQPTPQTTCASSSASSNASWMKVTEYTRMPVSAIPSEDAQSTPDKTGRLPLSPATSNATRTERMTMTPVMLVAEEMPVPRPRPAYKACKIVLKEGKSYAPRPRSASVPSIMQRRSRPGSRTPSRPGTPPEDHIMKYAPPLPSTPPKCALPPLPMTNGSTRSRRPKQNTTAYPRKPVPVRSYATYAAKADSDCRISTLRSKYQNWPANPAPAIERPDIYARVEALEKKNALLLDKLNTMAVAQGKGTGAAEKAPLPMAWEDRIARRSAATRFTANNGRAREVLTSARYGIR